MDSSYLPAGYKPLLDIRQTQVAIKKVKDFFERDLAIQLNLTRVSAPLFERYAAFEAQNRELKAQNKELLEKLNRIEAMLNAAEKPEAENTEEH